jgi:hypothetical protein
MNFYFEEEAAEGVLQSCEGGSERASERERERERERDTPQEVGGGGGGLLVLRGFCCLVFLLFPFNLGRTTPSKGFAVAWRERTIGWSIICVERARGRERERERAGRESESSLD